MRLLHTSDWHLGHSLHGHERQFEHERFLGWLLDTLEHERIDALLLAGDVYDSANPPAAAQRLFYGFLAEAARRLPGLQIVVIAGNHDSPARLEAPAALLAGLEVTVIGQVRDAATGAIDLERLVLPLRERGSGAVRAWCVAMPFLRSGDVPRVEGSTDTDAWAAGIAELYARAFELAAAQRQPGQALVAMGHCHLAGGEVSPDSERALVIGGIEGVAPSALAAADYVALGHLHRAQRVGAADRREVVRYSGSPLPMSFAEVGYRHQVLMVDLAGSADPDDAATTPSPVRAVHELPVPRSVGMLRVPATHQPLDAALQALAGPSLTDLPADLPATHWPWLEVRVQLDAPEPALRSRIEAALADRPVRLLRIDARSAGRVEEAAAPDEAAAGLALGDLERLDPTAIFERLHLERYGQPAAPELLAALAELRHADAQGLPANLTQGSKT